MIGARFNPLMDEHGNSETQPHEIFAQYNVLAGNREEAQENLQEKETSTASQLAKRVMSLPRYPYQRIEKLELIAQVVKGDLT